MSLLEIQSKLKAPKGQYNSFGKYSYRSCEDILEALKPLLKEHSATLTITDTIEQIGDRYYVKATAQLQVGETSHSVAAYAREDEQRKGMDGSQITGSASSYARKYALNGLFCIDDTKDADATNDHGKSAPEQPKAPPKKDDNFAPTEAQRKKFYAMAREMDLTDKLKEKIITDYGLNSSAHLSADQISKLIKWMEEQQ